ncbi:MAG: hypothetical protein ACREMH_03885, partial [Gemmatimonadales bacterium]
MGRGTHGLTLLFASGLAAAGLVQGCRDDRKPPAADEAERAAEAQGPLDSALVAEGKEIFRLDTFGDETFWTDSLELHEVIRASVTPKAALGLGLK